MSTPYKVSKFFKDDVPAFGSYDNCRKIANYIDGLKISMRKILYTLKKKYPGKEKQKTESVANLTAAETQYLHGAANLCGVCDTMAQNFVGANNYPLIDGNSGGFGTRINPTCAAPRYTRIAISDITSLLFNKDDEDIIGRQFFEGDYIEPQFFVPIFPILFLNGSHGLSTGFSQDIYPRNPKEIIKYILASLNKKTAKANLLPWFKGHTGKVEFNIELNRLESFGVVEKNSSTAYTITELPIEVDYNKYIDYLERLCDSGVILNYIDKCDPKTDKILFIIKTTRDFTKKNNNERDLYKSLGLIKGLSEQYNCIDENNRVKEFKSIEEILDAFINIRLSYYQKRKDNILNKLDESLKILISKALFVSLVIKNEINVNNVKRDDIVKKLETIEKITKVNDSYDYLLNMPIYTLTREKIAELKAQILKLKEEYNSIKNQTIQEIWTQDLKVLEKVI